MKLTRAFSAVVKAKPIAAEFPSNEALAQGMAATTVSADKNVMLLLQKDMMPVEVGTALALAGVPMSHIISMFAVDSRRINVMFNSPETMARFRTEYFNNKANIQQKMKIAERKKTKFILLSCVPGDFSDEELKKLLFGTNPPRIDSIYHERCPNEDGKLMWLTGRRFFRIPEEDFKKLNFDSIPTSIELAPGFRVLVKLEGIALRCHHCHETTHKIADCPNKDKPSASVSAVEALGLGLSDSSDSSSEDDEEEETPNIDDAMTNEKVDEQSPPKTTDVTQDTQLNTQQNVQQKSPTVAQSTPASTPVSARTRQHTQNPHDTTPKTWKPPSGKTPTKQILSKSKQHRVTTKKPTQQQLTDPHLLVKRDFPDYPVSPPAIWKQAPPDSFTHKFALLPKIEKRELKFLLSQERDLVLGLTPNMGLLREGMRGKDFGPPYTTMNFDSDIIFAPDPVFQFSNPELTGEEPLNFFTYYDDDTSL